MPIYEYACPKCGEFEVTQRITAPSLRRCPTCRAKVTKLISQCSFQLKGTGWYVTDYARKNDSKKPGKDAVAREKGAQGDGKAAVEATTKAKTEKKADTGTKSAAA